MTQTQNRIFDELGRLFTNAAGAAQGVRQEVETVLKTQAERLIADMDLVTREEFEAVRAMAQLAREENEALKARLEALETELASKAQAADE
jgi:BMFP domain-containing protein YqiC